MAWGPIKASAFSVHPTNQRPSQNLPPKSSHSHKLKQKHAYTHKIRLFFILGKTPFDSV